MGRIRSLSNENKFVRYQIFKRLRKSSVLTAHEFQQQISISRYHFRHVGTVSRSRNNRKPTIGQTSLPAVGQTEPLGTSEYPSKGSFPPQTCERSKCSTTATPLAPHRCLRESRSRFAREFFDDSILPRILNPAPELWWF